MGSPRVSLRCQADCRVKGEKRLINNYQHLPYELLLISLVPDHKFIILFLDTPLLLLRSHLSPPVLVISIPLSLSLHSPHHVDKASHRHLITLSGSSSPQTVRGPIPVIFVTRYPCHTPKSIFGILRITSATNPRSLLFCETYAWNINIRKFNI